MKKQMIEKEIDMESISKSRSETQIKLDRRYVLKKKESKLKNVHKFL